MPIDFNPQIFHVQPQIERTQRIVKQNCDNDVFVKTVNPLYDGIVIKQKDFGKIKKTDEQAILYTITNKNGASVDISSYGATITGIKVLDKNGKSVEITQGYDNVTPYEESPIGHAGGTIGPYANKIDGGKFTLDGKEYQLECNKDNGKTHSHGGSEGLDLKNWKAKKLSDGIEFSYLKKDMENGYPGNMLIKVTYKLDNDNNLHIQYEAKSDKDSLINLTNHTYFNLDGAENAEENSIYNHLVKLPNSTKITKTNSIGISTGEYLFVENTPFDFRKPKRISDVIDLEDGEHKTSKGFDNNYCIDGYDGKTLIEVADVKSEKTGIRLKVLTNLPGFQFYTANNLGKSAQPAGKYGKRYEKYSSFCVEPQFYPNAINVENFSEKGILLADDIYKREIVYSFDAE
ncbi:MAG: galactose mutarotase [Clostridia bacterium]|nr:galactose mutarotase [Clostridia bacterium]